MMRGGSSDIEYDRLVLQHMSWTASSSRLLNAPRFAGIYRVLDGVVFTEESDNEQADRNLTRLLLQFDREEGESEDEQELGPELLSQIKKMKIGKSTKSCSVCLLPFEKENVVRTLPCGHMYHNLCIKEWFKTRSRCPLCRMDIKKHLKAHLQEEG